MKYKHTLRLSACAASTIEIAFAFAFVPTREGKEIERVEYSGLYINRDR
jgi:hypothetical protein